MDQQSGWYDLAAGYQWRLCQQRERNDVHDLYPDTGAGLGGVQGQSIKIRVLRKYCSCLLVLILVAGTAVAQVGEEGMPQAAEGRLEVCLSTGYERQDFRWSIAGNSAGQDPNVYSELKWRAVGGPAVGLDLKWGVCGRGRVFGTR